MQLTEKQLKEVVVFNDNEKKKIVDEFEYYIKKKEGDNKDDPFLEVELQTTLNSEFKNNSTKSVILAPFNSTRSHISDNYMENEGITPLIMPSNVLKFADKCKEVNRQYMLNNNAELDNGVYNDNEEEQKDQMKVTEEDEPNDGLAGPNMEQINYQVNVEDRIEAPIPLSQQPSAFQSLNTSQVMIEDEKIERIVAEYGYTF